MKTRTRAQNIKVHTRYSSYNDVTFVVIKAGVVTMRGSVEGRGIPEIWHLQVGSKDWGKCLIREVRDHTLRGRGLEAMVKAMRAGRI